MESDKWRKDMYVAKNEGRVLLTILFNDEYRTVSGGWDDHWTGECWIYDNPRIPTGTVPIAWKRIPTPYFPQEGK